jgi:predicted MFS family arabinose efflux permease
VAGSLAVEPLRRRLGTKVVLTLDVIGTFLLVAVPAVTTSVWPVGVSMVVAGAGSAVWRVVVNSIRQTIVADELLGRVYASSRLISWGVLPVGAALGGIVAELFSVRTVFMVAASASFALIGVFWRHVHASDLAVGADVTDRP